MKTSGDDISLGAICRRAFTFNNTLPLGAPAAEVYFRLSKTCHIFLEIVLQDALISETGCLLHFFASPPPFSSLMLDFFLQPSASAVENVLQIL